MRRSHLILLLLSLLATAFASSAQQEPARIALLIGNQRYAANVGPLKNPHNDVDLVAASLKKLRFKVTVVKDGDHRRMDVAIKAHIDEVRRAGEGALSFFYYSGHGVANPDTQINYLIPVDVADANDKSLWNNAFEQNDIIEKLNTRAPRATHYVVFDACRNELRLSIEGKKALGAEKGFIPVAQTAGLLIAYSTAPKQTASDVGSGGGPYAKALAEELTKPGVEAVTMFRNVQLRVKESIGQDPWLSFPSLPAVYLAGRETAAPVVTKADPAPKKSAAPGVEAPAAKALSEAAVAWSGTDQNTAWALEAYIRRYGSTYFGDLAKARLEQLKRAEAAQKAATQQSEAAQKSIPPVKTAAVPPASIAIPSVTKPAPSVQPRVTPPQSGAIKVGVAGPFTGPNAVFGQQLRIGAELAAADLNAKGGVQGRKIELVFGDDVSDPKQGVAVANRFVADRVDVVIGHLNSGVSIPASDVYAENGILMITPSASNPKLTELGHWNVLRVCGRDDQQGLVAAEYMSRLKSGAKVALVHDKTTYGRDLTEGVKRALRGPGVFVKMEEGVNLGEKDFSALVAKLKASDVDLVYWGGQHTEGGLILRQMREAGVKAIMMSGDGLATDEFAAIAGPAAAGTLMTFLPDPQRRPEAADVVMRLRAKSLSAEPYTINTYAALQVFAFAATVAETLDGKAVAARARNGRPIPTVIGDLSFDKKGDLSRPDYAVYSWKPVGGRITYVQN